MAWSVLVYDPLCVDVRTMCVANACSCTGGIATVATGLGPTLCETTSTVDCSACNAGYVISAVAASGLQTCVGCMECYVLVFVCYVIIVCVCVCVCMRVYQVCVFDLFILCLF